LSAVFLGTAYNYVINTAAKVQKKKGTANDFENYLRSNEILKVDYTPITP
jgi:hypothetical protein